MVEDALAILETPAMKPSTIEELLQLGFITEALGHSAVGDLGNQLKEAGNLEPFCDGSNLGEIQKRVRWLSNALEPEAVHVLDRGLERRLSKLGTPE